MTKYLLILSAIFLAGCSAYFSVIGLMAIFSGNMLYAAIACSALELAKISAALALHKHWKEKGFSFIKWPLVFFTTVMMFVTSLGVFGMFAKGAQEHTMSSQLNTNQTEFIDAQIERIQTRKAVVESRLAELNGLVDLYTSQEQYSRARQGVQLYNRQQAQRQVLDQELSDLDAKEQQLVTQKLEMTNESKSIELEIGPIIYIAQLLYDSKELDAIEKSIQMVVILLVFIFDPFAICLLIAAQYVSRPKEPEITEIERPQKRQKRTRVKKNEKQVFTNSNKRDIIEHETKKYDRLDEIR